MRRVVVVSHDAGGAEIVSSWVRRYVDEWDCRFVLRGPATAIFRRKLGWEIPLDFVPRLRRGDFDLLVCGTSGGASLERDHIVAARGAGIRSVACLDHWTRYRERFYDPLRGLVLPDEVWVCDEHAYQLATAALPGVGVLLRGNPYLEDVLAEIRLLGRERAPEDRLRHVLFVAEPGRSRELARFLGEDRRDRVVRVRPHPSVQTPERTLAEDVAWADDVVGCDSMGLVVAWEAGRRVISLLPREERSLPYPEMEWATGP